jgi:hypothetical protein
MIDKRRSTRSDRTSEPAPGRQIARVSSSTDGSNIVESDLFWAGNRRLIRCKLGASPNRGDLRVEESHFPASDCGDIRPALPNGTVLLIPEEAAPQFLDDAAPRNGMMPPPDSEMIAPP